MIFQSQYYKIAQYGLAWLCYAILHIIVISNLVQLPTSALIVQGIIFSFILSSLGWLLRLIMQFGQYDELPILRQIINYSLLAILFVGIGVGLSSWTIYLSFGEIIFKTLLPTIPIQAFISLLLYVILLQYFKSSIQNKKQMDDLHEEQTEIPTPELPANFEMIDRISIKTGQKIDVIAVSDVFCLQAYGDYVLVFTESGKFVKEQTMKYFEEHLPRNQFVRVHRSYIVNVEQISKIELYEKQTQQITLKNRLQIKVSASGYKALRQVLGL